MKIVIYVFYALLLNFSISQSSYSEPIENALFSDTTSINNWNQFAYKNRLKNTQQTCFYASKALATAKKLNYDNGIAESYRLLGICNYYQNQSDIAIENYLNAIAYFTKSNNQAGIANVYNNIGNLYRDVEYDTALSYYKKSLIIAQKKNIPDLLGGLYLNMGTIFQKKKDYQLALDYYKKSNDLFTRINNIDGLTVCKQNLSIVYYYLQKYQLAEKYGVEAINTAKEYKLNYVVAGTNLTLSNTYIALGLYDKAELAIKEGLAFSRMLDDNKLESDYLHSSYELAEKQKNYQKALSYLKQVYKEDSAFYRTGIADKISFVEQRIKQKEKQNQAELIIEKEKNNKLMFWASTAIAGLAILMIILLVANVRKKIETNQQLRSLNTEILRQKLHLDKINQQQEDIILERTKDLQIKNQKLSDYTSYLSHQIRGPIATIKGLMFLEKEKLIDNDELIEQIQKCVDDIDDKIISINHMLNDKKGSSILK